MKCIKNDNHIIVITDTGVILQSAECDDRMYNLIVNATTEDEVIAILNPVSAEVAKEAQEATRILNRVEDSKILKKNGDSIYWIGISELSIPRELVDRILEAEVNEDEDALEAYKNFWTLLSLNPDALCRENLFKFLTKWGMVISKTGLFVGYRNVDTIYKDEYNAGFTDHHSHKFSIKIGEMVTMPRQNCDSDSHVSCSRGLHIGGTSWLNKNYFGDTGLVCLVNPADVVAVPFDNEEYGKLRTCAYLPIAIAHYDEHNKVIPYTLTDGFEAPFVKTILYDGMKSSEDKPAYTIIVPELPELSKESVTQRVLEIARTYMK